MIYLKWNWLLIHSPTNSCVSSFATRPSSILVWSWYWGSISVWFYCRETNGKVTEIEIFQDQINDRENAGNWALSFTDIISPVEPGWLFCLWVRVCVPMCYRKIVFVVTFLTFLSWFSLWLCGCHFFPDWEQYVRMVVSCLVLFKLYLPGLYRDWLANAFCVQLMLIVMNIGLASVLTFVLSVIFFFILTDGFVELQARFLSIFSFPSVLCSYFILFPFPFLSCLAFFPLAPHPPFLPPFLFI